MQKYDIVRAKLDPVEGSEQGGVRPCLIVQNNHANASAMRTVTVIPCSSVLNKTPDGLFVQTSKENGLTKDTRMEVSQIRTISLTRVTKHVGKLEPMYYQPLREKLIRFLDLNDVFV